MSSARDATGGPRWAPLRRPWPRSSRPPRQRRRARLPPAPDLRTARVVDLTHPFDERTPYWPTAPRGFELEQLALRQDGAGYFYSAYGFCAPEHGGTHLDAAHPLRRGRLDGGPGAGRSPGPPGGRDRRGGGRRPPIPTTASPSPTSRPGRRATAASRKARSSSCARAGARAGRTGSATWATTRRATPRGCTSRPIGPEAARWLVAERAVAALGVDTASIDHGPSKDFAVHRIVAAANVAGLENLAGLEPCPDRGLGHRPAHEDRARLRRPPRAIALLP